jgi:hypothetical protein
MIDTPRGSIDNSPLLYEVFGIARWPGMMKALLISFGLTACLGPSFAVADDEGQFEGAIWQYEMSRVSGKGDARTGRFRIHGTEIFQPRDMKPTVIGAIEGKMKEKPAKGDKVKVKFEQLRGSDQKTLKCEGPITFVSFGEVKGRLIDSDGVHWNFKASRILE